MVVVMLVLVAMMMLMMLLMLMVVEVVVVMVVVVMLILMMLMVGEDGIKGVLVASQRIDSHRVPPCGSPFRQASNASFNFK